MPDTGVFGVAVLASVVTRPGRPLTKLPSSSRFRNHRGLEFMMGYQGFFDRARSDAAGGTAPDVDAPRQVRDRKPDSPVPGGPTQTGRPSRQPFYPICLNLTLRHLATEKDCVMFVRYIRTNIAQ
jgi:hypothetical protein